MNIIKIISLVCLFVILTACQSEQPRQISTIGDILWGKHELNHIYQKTQTNASLSGGLFLFIGEISGEQTQTEMIYFSWKMHNGSYAISKLPLTKIRVRLKDNALNPTIKFRWNRYHLDRTMGIDDIFEYLIIYAEITCKPEDWKPNIEMPLSNLKNNGK